MNVMKFININIKKYFHMIPLWKSPSKLPVELPVELPVDFCWYPWNYPWTKASGMLPATAFG